ncbi:MAG: serine hydrolase domain-containing protein [Phycisphaerales bacterium]
MLTRAALTAFMLIGPIAAAQDAAAPPATVESAPADLRDILEPIRLKAGLPALAGVIFSDHAVLARGVCGVRSLGDPTPAELTDLWHLGSCSKAMTATLIATMVDRGELSWDDKLPDLLPEFATEIDAGYSEVPLRQLLTMTAGVPTDLSPDGLWDRLWKHKGTPTSARAVLTRSVLAKPPVHTPGSKSLYSNASFAIAGHIAEVRAGVAFEQLITDRLFTPLGITTAGFGAPGAAGRVDQPRGHDSHDKPKSPGPESDNPEAITPAGRVHMSMDDWAKFLMLHLRESDVPPVSTKSMAELHRPSLNSYAMGWAVAERPWGGTVLTHSGSNTMWFCVTWLSPGKKFGVAVATNTASHDAPKAADEAAWALIRQHIEGARAK